MILFGFRFETDLLEFQLPVGVSVGKVESDVCSITFLSSSESEICNKK
jgi:hypothetical protein